MEYNIPLWLSHYVTSHGYRPFILDLRVMAHSLSEACTPLKHQYDSCFNAWFEGYLEPAVAISPTPQRRAEYSKQKAEEFQQKCGKLWDSYRDCVQVHMCWLMYRQELKSVCRKRWERRVWKHCFNKLGTRIRLQNHHHLRDPQRSRHHNLTFNLNAHFIRPPETSPMQLARIWFIEQNTFNERVFEESCYKGDYYFFVFLLSTNSTLCFTADGNAWVACRKIGENTPFGSYFTAESLGPWRRRCVV